MLTSMQQSTAPYEARNLYLCIDTYENGEASGRLYGGIKQAAVQFHAILPLLRMIDDILDSDARVSRFEQNRALLAKAVQQRAQLDQSQEISRRPGEIATFAIRVHFRQNATWQGEVVWVEKRKSNHFRSALELIYMLDDVLYELSANKTVSISS